MAVAAKPGLLRSWRIEERSKWSMQSFP
jgi:hypothetical protein